MIKVLFIINIYFIFKIHNINNEGITIKAVSIKKIPQSPFSQSTRAPEEDAKVVLPAVPIEANKAY